MRPDLFKQLKQHFSQDPIYIDRLIISGFLSMNSIVVENNTLLQQYIITAEDVLENNALSVFLGVLNKYEDKFDFETLIELFEFVISPSEKVVNGAVYTPEFIREYIVNTCLANYSGDITEIKAADISCGCGGFLLTVAKYLYNTTEKSYRDIFRDNLYGVDIADYSVQRAKILLTLYAVANGEDENNFEFNFYVDNSLAFNWRKACPEIGLLGGFDILVGNPPYVCSRNMDVKTLLLLQTWEVAKSGHPDLYIPFFQIGVENLNMSGILGYITVNTFIKSINGRALREYFSKKNINITILNFGGEQIFKDRNTYTCICFIRKGNGQINYVRTTSQQLSQINLESLRQFQYKDLNHHDGWNLVNDVDMVNFINIVENTGVQFKNLYETKNGIATLKNEVYKFKPILTDDDYYYLQDTNDVFRIEREICKNIVNANKIKTTADIERLREQIIFPYNDQTEIIPENIMRRDFPGAYTYLKTKEDMLSKRDKGDHSYEAWYAYGRRQSMDIHAYKLFFPHICDRPTFVICEDQDLLFYNGMAIVSNDLEDLKVIKKILESDLFFTYIRNTTKDYASGYISMSRNYLKNFGVCQLDDHQKAELLETTDVDKFLARIYGLA